MLLRSQLVDDGDAAGVLTDLEWCNNSERCIGERLHFQREVEERDRQQGDPKQRGCCCPAQGEAEKGRAAKDGSGGDEQDPGTSDRDDHKSVFNCFSHSFQIHFIKLRPCQHQCTKPVFLQSFLVD